MLDRLVRVLETILELLHISLQIKPYFSRRHLSLSCPKIQNLLLILPLHFHAKEWVSASYVILMCFSSSFVCPCTFQCAKCGRYLVSIKGMSLL